MFKKYLSTSTTLRLAYQSITEEGGGSLKSTFCLEVRKRAAARPDLAPQLRLTLADVRGSVTAGRTCL